ncbi:DNA gyrase inhibitor YacG [Meridianimarinicoccus aquatilis]|uniref:DNA gyrase inhibitor YacG n=1 Tax=Meridianimarinicoccus aquatilis TaxID=2552766 RepID=A0A4R6AZN7_9RHOB|nr:DNA gyrase inhibitor YacG [Fluviibacterium aquatile]QIE42629.1 DNA gyrase inhibitor YacG [Rhodobacteraceae bacterium SC52]TDL87916.1 DNA gyrase inhibitor YacG [Fluviibacterium aquatile]
MICPICNKAEAAEQYRPFCSRRCADIDLGKWLTGGYSIPASHTDEDDDEIVAATETDDMKKRH